MRLHLDQGGILRHLHGWCPPAPHEQEAALGFALAAPPEFGEPAVDLRTTVPVVPVKDQGSLGLCVSFGSSSCVEFVCSKEGESGVQLSELWMHRQYQIQNGIPAGEDSGATVAGMFQGVVGPLGAPDEKDWPYVESKFADTPPTDLVAKHAAPMILHLPDLLTMRACLALGFPFAGGFSVPSSFMDWTYSTGELSQSQANSPFVGKHCTGFFGYDDNRKIGDDTGGFLSLNSWSTRFGIGGWFWMSYAFAKRFLTDCWSPRSAAL